MILTLRIKLTHESKDIVEKYHQTLDLDSIQNCFYNIFRPIISDDEYF